MTAVRATPILIALCALGLLTVQTATWEATALARPAACSLLADGLKEQPIFLSSTDPEPGNNAISCTRSDGKPIGKTKWSVRFWFVPYPAGALDVAWKSVVSSYRKGKQPYERLHGFGADDAYATQGVYGGSTHRVSTVGVAWRKGVYIGGLMLTRPSPNPKLDDDDIDDAAEVLKGSLRRLPRR